VCRCVSAPKMLESLWAIRFLKVSDAEAPEDVKATLDVFHLVEDGWRLSGYPDRRFAANQNQKDPI